MGTPSDWVSGERVFAPPSGTLDVDWLVPAVVEAVPGSTPVEARAALVRVCQATQAGRAQAPAEDPTQDDPLHQASARVVAEALRTFRA